MKKAFTLIELLIVVAIIAILAAIAVPNFLEAQTRSKVSRVKSDLRTLVTCLETYRIDNNAYPQSNGNGTIGWNNALTNVTQNIDPAVSVRGRVFEKLSTPIAYATSALLNDAFPTQSAGIPNSTTGDFTTTVPFTTDIQRNANRYYKYAAIAFENAGAVTAEVNQSGGSTDKANACYFVYSSGPDNTKTELRGSGILGTLSATIDQAAANNVYDPTNGTVSKGDVYRAGGQAADARGKALFDILTKQN